MSRKLYGVSALHERGSRRRVNVADKLLICLVAYQHCRFYAVVAGVDYLVERVVLVSHRAPASYLVNYKKPHAAVEVQNVRLGLTRTE